MCRQLRTSTAKLFLFGARYLPALGRRAEITDPIVYELRFTYRWICRTQGKIWILLCLFLSIIPVSAIIVNALLPLASGSWFNVVIIGSLTIPRIAVTWIPMILILAKRLRLYASPCNRLDIAATPLATSAGRFLPYVSPSLVGIGSLVLAQYLERLYGVLFSDQWVSFQYQEIIYHAGYMDIRYPPVESVWPLTVGPLLGVPTLIGGMLICGRAGYPGFRVGPMLCLGAAIVSCQIGGGLIVGLLYERIAVDVLGLSLGNDPIFQSRYRISRSLCVMCIPITFMWTGYTGSRMSDPPS